MRDSSTTPKMPPVRTTSRWTEPSPGLGRRRSRTWRVQPIGNLRSPTAPRLFGLGPTFGTLLHVSACARPSALTTVLSLRVRVWPTDCQYRNLITPSQGYAAGFLLEKAAFILPQIDASSAAADSSVALPPRSGVTTELCPPRMGVATPPFP